MFPRVFYCLLALLAAGSALAQVGTPEEQAARRSCWQEIVGAINQQPSDAQVMPLDACVTKALGRPDPYMERIVKRHRENAAGNYGEEKTDFGVPVQTTPFDGNLGEATPARIPGAQVVTTVQMEAIVQSNAATIFDVWDGSPGAFPNAIWAAYLGAVRTDDAGEKALRDRFVAEHGDLKRSPIVFLCASSKCRESYNASRTRPSRGLHQREVVSRRISVVEAGGELNSRRGRARSNETRRGG